MVSASASTAVGRPPRVLVTLAAIACLVALIPLVYLVIRVSGAGFEQVVEVLGKPRTVETVLTSIGLAIVVVVGCLVLGFSAAVLLARVSLPGRRWWVVLLALPLAIPSYVAAYAWLSFFPGMSGFWAAALILTLVSFPYVFLPTFAALRLSDAGLEEVARTLGRGPIAAFRTVTLPQVWPAAAAGSLLVALYTLSDFGAVALFRVDAFTRVIYASYRASFDRSTAAILALVLVLLALILILIERRVRGRRATYRTSSSARRSFPRARVRSGYRALALAFLGAVCGLALVLPLAALIQRLLQGSRRPLDPLELGQAILTSAWVSVVGAVIAVVLAIPVALVAARYRGKRVEVIEGAAYSSHALPGVVVGLSLVFITVAVIPAAYQTVVTLAFAYAVLFWPKSIGASRSAVASVPPVLGDVARTLGRSPLRAWLGTTLRIAWPGIAAGGLLVVLTAMKELPATLMLRPTGLDTLATELWSRTEVAAYGAAAPYALALVALAAIPAWLLGTRLDSAGDIA